MFINPTFDSSLGLEALPEADNIFVPFGWTLGWKEGEFEGIAEGQNAHRPEAVVLNEWMGLEDEFFPQDSYTWKIFGSQCLFSYITPIKNLVLPKGKYTISISVWPKLHLLEDSNPHPSDPWAGEVGLRVHINKIQWRSHLDYSSYNFLQWTFEHTGGEVPIKFYFKGKYPLDNSFFVHNVSIQAEDSSTITIDLSEETKKFLSDLVSAEEIKPREYYDKVSVLYDSTILTEEELYAIFDAMEKTGKYVTFTPSADDAGMGWGLHPHIYVLHAESWGGTNKLFDFYEKYYRNVTLTIIEYTSPENLYDVLVQAWGGEGTPVSTSMTIYSQRDPEWADKYLGYTTYTLGGSGCALVSTTMLATLVDPKITPDEHNNLVTSKNGYTNDGRLKWGVAAEVIPGLSFLSYDTYRGNSTYKLAADLVKIDQLLSTQNYLIFQVDSKPNTSALNSHFVTVIAPVIKNNKIVDFTIADPYYGDTTTLLTRYGKGSLEQSIFAVAAFYLDDSQFTRPYRRGVHGAPVTHAPKDVDKRIKQYKDLGVTVIKILDDGRDPMKVEFAKRLIAAGIEPIVRIYDSCGLYQGANRNLESAKAMIAAGVTKFEIMNEPNIEWDGVDWHKSADISRVASVWYEDAQKIIAWGGKPALPAMAPTDRGGVNERYSGVNWLTKILIWLKDNKNLQCDKVWIAVHLLPFNKSFDSSPIVSWGVDDMCVRYYEVLQHLCKDIFDYVPEMISTEGGVVSPKHMKDLGWPSDGDTVYDPEGLVLYDIDTWGEYTLKLDRFLRERGGPTICTWTGTDEGVHDKNWHGCGWYDIGGVGRAPVKSLQGG